MDIIITKLYNQRGVGHVNIIGDAEYIKEEGIIIAPIINGSRQILKKFKKINNKITIEILSNVLFVPNLSGIKD